MASERKNEEIENERRIPERLEQAKIKPNPCLHAFSRDSDCVISIFCESRKFSLGL